MPRNHALEQEIERTEHVLAKLRAELHHLHTTCSHQWGSPVYDPHHRDAYTIQGDPPGTMGVDRQLPTYVPAKTIPRWKRECKECGLVEYTTEVKEVPVAQVPRFKGE